MMPSSYTGVRFVNRVEDTPELNVFTYRNFYNGGGVAVGDFNGDGLPELILTSNLQGSRLYLNKGHFQFQDITDEAGVGGKGYWATGVTVADVNGDGKLDIYVCYAGNIPGKRRANELYINQGLNKDGVPIFREITSTYSSSTTRSVPSTASDSATPATSATDSAGTSFFTMTATGTSLMSVKKRVSSAARSPSGWTW